VFGSGDVIEPEQAIERLRTTAVSGVLVGRGVLRNPWILAQAQDLAEGRPARAVTLDERGRFLLDYLDLLLVDDEAEPEGFRHTPVKDRSLNPTAQERAARGRERWVINKLRALCTWYTKGLENGSHLRTSVNQCESIGELREIVSRFFFEPGGSAELQRRSAAVRAAAFEG
jgi:tRNA-dihydrouridine synthase B